MEEKQLIMVKLTRNKKDEKIVKESWLMRKDVIKEVNGLMELHKQKPELAYDFYFNILKGTCKQAKEFYK